MVIRPFRHGRALFWWSSVKTRSLLFRVWPRISRDDSGKRPWDAPPVRPLNLQRGEGGRLRSEGMRRQELAAISTGACCITHRYVRTLEAVAQGNSPRGATGA